VLRANAADSVRSLNSGAPVDYRSTTCELQLTTGPLAPVLTPPPELGE
jgi:hypothetical protein